MRGLRDRGALDRTWILIVADHGESLGEHGEPGHSMLLYGATQQVPCLLIPPAGDAERPPGVAPGRRVDDLVRLCDLANTLLNALGFDARFAIGEGSSLLPLLAGQWEGPRLAYCETLVPFLEYGWSELRSVRVAGWSYVRAPEPELYDLQEDPHELVNLHDARPDIARRLAAWCDLLAARESALEVQRLDPATIARLRSLGYVAGGMPTGTARNEKDPKRLMPLFNEINAARTALGARRAPRAAQMLRAVLAEDPGNPEALRLLGVAQLRMGDGAGAVAVYDSLGQAFPDDREVRLGRARALLLARRLSDAAAVLQRLLDELPEDDDARELYAQLLLQDDRADEAIVLLTAAIRRAPDRAAPRVALARLRWAQEQMEEAQEVAEDALRIAPEDAGARAILGECLWWRSVRAANSGDRTGAERLRAQAEGELRAAIAHDPVESVAAFRLATLARERGETSAAIDYYERVLVHRPDRPEVHVNLGNLLRESGRVDEALRAYRTAEVLGYENVSFLVNYGVALAMRGRLSEAQQTWERALERAPDEGYADGIRRNIELLRERRRAGSVAPPGDQRSR
jgi:tetratricopeptide (TPR) repeat protein